MIELEEVLKIHQILIEKFGGASGVRDKGMLKSAIERPFSGFGEIPFYPTPEEKAAAILESIVVNHPFVDGNKRTGYVLMRSIMMNFGKDIIATQDEKYNLVIDVASAKISFDGIVSWLQTHQ